MSGMITWLRRTSILQRILIALLLICMGWCWASLSSPSRFIFLPLGDVGGGFRSYDGKLSWIHHAPWQQDPDGVIWTMSWWPVFVTLVVAIGLLDLQWRKREGHCNICDNSYKKVGPLIEGMEGALLCGACLESAMKMLGPSSDRKSNLPDQGNDVIRQQAKCENSSGNPYESPIVIVGCRFCGQESSDTALLNAKTGSYCLCRRCVELSLKMLDEERAKIYKELYKYKPKI
jgi:hypothetical protein